MTDKEILTEKQAKSIGMTFPPSLATPSAGNKLTAGADPQANNVYQSVSQKGKLILPTALWILLVLAGITFLSLLATLNKSMSTLDALVEIEQHNRIDEELKKFSREMQKNSANIELLPVSEALKLEDKSNDDEDLTLVDSSPLKSFLSFSDWASLEPRRSKLMKDDGEFSSFINDVFSSMQRGKQPNKLSPISESIIIASGNLDPRRAQNQFQSNNPIGALLEGLLGDGLATSKTDSVQQQPLIQANIDRVNINVNTHEDSQKSNKRPLKGQQEEQQHDREMINSIDKSIDNLMAQLVEPQLQKTQANDMPTSLLDHSMFKPTVNHNHNHPLNQLEQLGPNPSPFSPISNLIFPFEMPPPFNSLEPKEFHHSNRHNQNQKNIQMNDILLSPIPMFGKPKLPVNEPPASILMIESGPAPYDQFIPFEQLMPISALPSGKSHRKDGQKQQQIGEKQADQQLSFMDENLLGSLAQSFLQGQEISPIKQTHGTSELSKLTNGNSNDDDIETIVFVNGQPIINEKKQSLATSEADLVSMKKKNDKSKDKNEIKDLFQMFFGEPPKNSLAVAPTSEIPSITMVKSLDDGASSSNKKEESDILKLDKEKVNISESAPGDNTKEAQQEVDNFFGKFLSLPQFAGDEQVMKVEPMAEKEQKNDDEEGWMNESIGPKYLIDSSSLFE